jgi:NACalpha-BTF3-like transcription factor
VPRLLELRERGEFQSDHVRLVAEQLEITEGTVRRWLKAATGNYAHFSSAISRQVTWPPVLSPG